MIRLILVIALAGTALATAQDIEFNRDVRPILSDRCFACHGPDAGNRKSALRLDVESEAKRDLGGGRRGIKAGDPSSSGLIRRVTSRSPALRMPPQYAGKDALRDEEIEILRKWIAEGAPYEKHWSFVPPRKRALPEVKNQSWVRNPIDRFVLARLEHEGLRPAREADPATLLRRVSLDLTGLPPSGEADGMEYGKLVDRLLTSPRYAERMAIRWLEAARYSDTNGYQTDGPREMWRWRDWVIEAFGRNMPFDQFTVEQLAGDLLPGATMEQRLATGFHRNHRTSAEGGIVDEEFRVEYVADRTETTSTVWLGLTIGCARCHDHKYDPLPQTDYYSLFAFFNNVPEKGFVYNFGNEPPFIKAPLPAQQHELAALDARLAAARSDLQALDPRIEKAQRAWEGRLPRDLGWNVNRSMALHVPETHQFDGKNGLEIDGKATKFDYQDAFTYAAWVNPATANGAILSQAEDYFEGSGHALYVLDGKLRLHAIFRWTDLGMRVESQEPLAIGKWQHVAVSYDGGMRASGVRMYVNGLPVKTKILFDSMIWPIDVKEPFRIGAGGGMRFEGGIRDVRIFRRALSAEEAAVLPVETPLRDGGVSAAFRLRSAFLELAPPPEVGAAMLRVETAEKARDEFYASIPTSMVMEDMPQPRETFLLQRGAYDAPGERVFANVPAVLPPLPEGIRHDRLALARWIVSRENPLTARVFVNRLWQMLWGTGLVKTAEDFGSQGEQPSHPELLDWLAVEFMDSGWDVKHMLRLMVTSSTYRQSSSAPVDAIQRDPENRLLARGARFRLPAEMIRDQALAASGLLVEKTGGPSVKPYQPPGLWEELQGGKGYVADKGEGLWRRSLYTYWKRTVAPPSMINFDSPSREVCVVRTSRTNTPLQALNLMNDVTYLEAARKLGERMMREGGIERGYQLLLARAPDPEESALLSRLLARSLRHYESRPEQAEAYLNNGAAPLPPSATKAELAAWTSVASLLLNLDEAVTRQ